MEQNKTLKQLNDELSAQLQEEKSLNENLLRISRERANDKNGIPKDNNGYLVKISSQLKEKYSLDDYDEDPIFSLDNYFIEFDENSKNHKKSDIRQAYVWRTLLSTPYNASLPFTTAKYQIESELKSVLGDLSINYYNLDGTFKRWYDKKMHEVNGLFRIEYVANYLTGFWDIQIYTTLPPIVPESYRKS